MKQFKMTEEEYNLKPMYIIGAVVENDNVKSELVGFFPDGKTNVIKLTYQEYLDYLKENEE
jgi:hypothetical protein